MRLSPELIVDRLCFKKYLYLQTEKYIALIDRSIVQQHYHSTAKLDINIYVAVSEPIKLNLAVA